MGVWEHLSGNFEWKVPEIFNEEVIVEKLNVVIADVLSTITTMPTLSSMTGVMPIYNFVKIIAYSCTAAIVCYKGIKIMFSPEEFNGAKEGRELFTRITYSLAYTINEICRYHDRFLQYIDKCYDKELFNCKSYTWS